MEWIKCSDQLPKDGQAVIVTDCEHVGEYFYMQDHFETDEGYCINGKYWMPLPKPPQE